jgi:hypothetical protein
MASARVWAGQSRDRPGDWRAWLGGANGQRALLGGVEPASAAGWGAVEAGGAGGRRALRGEVGTRRRRGSDGRASVKGCGEPGRPVCWESGVSGEE